MPSFYKTAALAAMALAGTAFAQTHTDCNPMEKDDCPDNMALGVANYTIDFTDSMMSDRVWNSTNQPIGYGDAGAEFVIHERGESPTVKTNFYIFFGQVEVVMKASPGTGIVSSVVMQSEDLDEVDWEWIGGNNSYVQSNYFGKGNTTSFDRAIWHPVDDVQGQWHNYTVDWTPEKLDWYIDGQMIRSLPYGEANGGYNFPQTPCNVRLGIWAGGDPELNPEGTVEWAGGETNFDELPFTMLVKSVRVSDASRGTSYHWSDNSGSMQSIKILNETEPIELDGSNSGSATQSLEQKWNGLSPTTKYIIGGVVGGVALLMIAIFAFCCIRQRRAGRHEKLLEDAKYDKNTAEVMAYRAGASRMRSEKMYEMGNAGAMYNHPSPQPSQNSRLMRDFSPLGGPGYANNGYAQSVSTFGSGRGYQKY